MRSVNKGRLIIWDLDTKQPAQTLDVHYSWLNPVAWSADGRLASGSDNNIVVWDLSKEGLKRGLQPQILEGHSGSVLSVVWSPDGRLASGANDYNVIIWDLERGLPAHTLKGHSHQVMSVAWSPDGRLASGSYDQTVQVWNMDPGEWIRQACYRAGRNLTQAEWALFLPGKDHHKTCEAWSAGGQLTD